MGRLDQGLATLCRLSRFGSLNEDALYRMLRINGDLGGSVPWLDIMPILLSCELVGLQDGVVEVTDAGHELCRVVDSRERSEGLRNLLGSVIRHSRRDLLVLAYMRPEEIRLFADIQVVQILEELSLLAAPLGEKARLWWMSLRRAAKSEDEAYLKKLGDKGEAKSLGYERRRLEACGQSELFDQVMWLSRIDEGAGFDILSFVGNGDSRRLRIEVKVSGVSARPSSRFFLSRNEWEVASEGSIPYVVHLWRVSDLRTDEDVSPQVIPVGKLSTLVPADSSSICAWTECVIVWPPNAGT